MKPFYKFIITALIVVLITSANAQPKRVIYDENEVTLPNFLQYQPGPANESSINGRMENNLIYISWRTAAETNTSHFELQRSNNGNNFEPIETITSGRITTTPRYYQTTDETYNSAEPTMYYRLKLVFTNGKESFTNAIMLDLYTSAATVYNGDKK